MRFALFSLQCFAVFSSCSVFTSSKGHNRPQYAQICQNRPQRSKETKNKKRPKKTKKKQRFLETVGIGGMSLVFVFFFLFFLVFLVFFGLLGADLIFRHLRSPGFSVYRAAAGLFRVATLVLRILVVGISRRFAFQNKILSSTPNLWLQGRRPFKMKFFLRIHALNTSLILVLTSLNRLASLRVSLHFLHLWLPRWNSSTMKCLMFSKCHLQRLGAVHRGANHIGFNLLWASHMLQDGMVAVCVFQDDDLHTSVGGDLLLEAEGIW